MSPLVVGRSSAPRMHSVTRFEQTVTKHPAAASKHKHQKETPVPSARLGLEPQRCILGRGARLASIGPAEDAQVGVVPLLLDGIVPSNTRRLEH